MRSLSRVLKKTIAASAVALIGLALIPGTASAGLLGSPEGTGIPNVEWHLVDHSGVYFNTDGENFNGSDSCNSLFGEAKVMDGNPKTVTFGPGYSSTRMACLGETEYENEQIALAAFHDVRTAEFTEDHHLVLRDPETGEAWEFEPGA